MKSSIVEVEGWVEVEVEVKVEIKAKKVSFIAYGLS
jgi:hypothetical protein